MRLERIGSSSQYDCEAESYDYKDFSAYRGATNDREHIHNHFLRFGTGSDGPHDFRVSLNWSDVDALIRAFSEMGHREAIRLQRALKFATAAEEFVTNSN